VFLSFSNKARILAFQNSDITYNPLSKTSATFTRLNIYLFIFLSPLSQTCHNFFKKLIFLGKAIRPQKGLVSIKIFIQLEQKLEVFKGFVLNGAIACRI
jgi:hypothetical protein